MATIIGLSLRPPDQQDGYVVRVGYIATQEALTYKQYTHENRNSCTPVHTAAVAAATTVLRSRVEVELRLLFAALYLQ